jgi:hypothetical protein
MAALGNVNPSVAQMVEYSNERKRSSGEPGIWARLLCEAADAAGEEFLAVNGIRNPGEIVSMRNMMGDDLVLVGIVAPLTLRAERAMKRAQKGDPQDLAGFMAMDDRDRGIGEPPDGQQVDRCLAQVPHENVYNNKGTLGEYFQWINDTQLRIAQEREARLAAQAGAVKRKFSGEFGELDSWGDPVVQYGVAGPPYGEKK